MDELAKMGKRAAINKMAELEQKRDGSLEKYIKKIAPNYIDHQGHVMKFCLLKDLGWL